MSSTTLHVPRGFTELECDPFMEPLGPIYGRPGTDGLIEVGLHISPRHANLYGGAHGGMLAALVDFALGINVLAAARGADGPIALGTVSLNVDYVSGASPGEWLVVKPAIDKRSGRIRFCSCVVETSDGRIVLRATAVLSAIKPNQPQIRGAVSAT